MQVLLTSFLLEKKKGRPNNIGYLTGGYLNYFIPLTFISAETRLYFMKASKIKSALLASSE